ncbi:MAG: OmpH family outer membrane protein [Alistipes sp.]|nr:OmpH family outer membrane protein [Alistipes sp.]
MKKVIKLALVLVCVMCSTSLYAQKFARINLQKVISAMPEIKTLQSDIESFAKELGEQLEVMQVEYNNKVADFQKNSATMNESVRNLKEKELYDLQQRIGEFQQIAQQDIEKKQMELYQPIHVKASEAVKKVASAAGYTAVFDTSMNALAYVDESSVVDIEAAVCTELGINEIPATPAAN